MLATRLVTLGDALRRGAWFGSATMFVRAGLAVLYAGRGENHQQRLAALNILGIVRKDSGRLDEAELIYRDVLRGLSQLADPSPVALANIHHNLAGLAHARGDYLAGEAHARKAIGYRLGALGPDHPDVAGDRGVLGALFAGQGRDDDARAVFRDVLAAMEHHHGVDHYEVAVVLNHLACLDRDTDPISAMATYKRALAIKRRTLGAGHPEIAMLLNNIGVLHRRQGRPQEAAACYRRALPILLHRLGPTHPITGACRRNIALLSGDVYDPGPHLTSCPSIVQVGN